MPNILKHGKVSLIADDPDTNLVRPSDWNQEHKFTGGSNGQILQRSTLASDGVRWADGEGVDVSALATDGDGTTGDPWVNWELAVNLLPPGSRIHFPKGEYRQTVQITMKSGWYVFGDTPLLTKINIVGAIKGWVWSTATLTDHANIHMKYLGLWGDAANTLALIDVTGGFHFEFHRLYLFNSTTYGLKAKGILQLALKKCDIEHNLLVGAYLGDNGANGYCNDWMVEENLFGGTDQEIHLGLEAASAGKVVANGFEHGKYGTVLNNAGRIDISDNFYELHTDSSIRTTGLTSQISIKRNHLNNADPGDRVDIDFSANSDEHEAVTIEDNQHMCFGGTHTSILLFNPGATKSYRFLGNKVYPVANRPSLEVTYVAGYPRSDLASFVSDVILLDEDFPTSLGKRILLSYAGEADPFVYLERVGNDLEINTTQAGSLLTITNGTQETVFGNDISSFQTGKVLIDSVGALAAQGLIQARSGTATVAGGAQGILLGSGLIGIYWGSGAPTISANKGSIYLRTDGSSSSTRLYTSDGGTTWIAVTTAS